MSAIKATLAFAAQLAEKGLLVGKQGNSNPLFSMSKYMKYGLLTDDLQKDSNAITKEALRRLPKDVFQERQWRLARAIGANANKDVLHESEWIKPEQVIWILKQIAHSMLLELIHGVYFFQDVSYLKPLVQQVVNEQREKDAWNSGKFQ